MDSTQQEVLQRLYADLVSLQKNLPGSDPEEKIKEEWVNDFHSILKSFSVLGIEVDSYYISSDRIQPKMTSFNPRTGAMYSKEKYCERAALLSKVDSLLLRIQLKERDLEVELIGFKLE